MLPSVAELLNTEHYPLFEYSESRLSVTEERILFEDELQQSDQTFTLLARCCMHSHIIPASEQVTLHTMKSICLICESKDILI